MSNVLYSNFPLAGIASVGATIFTNPLEVRIVEYIKCLIFYYFKIKLFIYCYR